MLESLCVGGFLFFYMMGRQSLAFALLAGPLQAAAWLALMRDDYRVLMFFNALIMLTPLELLPRYYLIYCLFPGTAMIFLFTAWTGFLQERSPARARLGKSGFVPALLLALWVVVAAVHALCTWGWKGWSTYNMLLATALGVEAIIIGYAYATVPRNTNQIRRLVEVLAFIVVLSAFVLVFLPAPRGEGGALGGKVVETPFGLANLNVYGTITASMAALLLGLFVHETRGSVRVVQGAALLLLLAALIVTKSRGAWLGFGAAVLYLVLRSRSRWLVIATAVALLVVLSVDVLRRVVLVRAADTSLRDPSLTGRYLLWYYGWKVAKANWVLGVGMDYFRATKHSYGFPAPFNNVWLRYHTHNLFMELLANTGVVGLGCFLWMLVGSFWRLQHRVTVDRTETQGLALGISAALIAFVVHGLWDAVIWQYGALMLLAALIGLAVAFNRVASVRREADATEHGLAPVSRSPVGSGP